MPIRNSQRMMSAMATSFCASSQGTKPGSPRSPSISTSESMSQRILGFAVQLRNLAGDRVSGCTVQFVGSVRAEKGGCFLARHETAVGNQTRDWTSVFSDANALSGFDKCEKLTELPDDSR